VSNLGKWAPWYDQLAPDAQPEAYGDSPTYEMGARWLECCDRIEDWGCGKGWLRTLVEPERYVGIDGTAFPFADVVTDLTGYVSEASGIFMRGVLEHDYRWPIILIDAVKSFRMRMALVLFTPMSSTDSIRDQIGFTEELGVPDLSLPHRLLMAYFQGLPFVAWRDIESPGTAYGVERIYFLEK
jgi:hypothetical protein